MDISGKDLEFGVQCLKDFGVEKIHRQIFSGEEYSCLRYRSLEELAAISEQMRVVKINGSVFGTYGLVPYGQSVELILFWVNPDYRGISIGSKVLELAIREANCLGFEFIFACTTSDKVKRIFERFSFVEVTRNDVPAEKWIGYSVDRKPWVLKRTLGV